MSDLKTRLDVAICKALSWRLEVSDLRNNLQREVLASTLEIVEAELATLTAERDAALAQVGSLQAERDTYKAAFENIAADLRIASQKEKP